MPRFPGFSRRAESLPGSVYEKYKDRVKAVGSEVIRLHIGDTWMHPPYPLPLLPEFVQQRDQYNRYCNTYGTDELRRSLAEKVKEDNGLEAKRANILVTNGATNALALATTVLVDPGEEVMILTPAWPFFMGMVKLAGGVPMEIPFYIELYDHPGLDVQSMIEDHISDKTVAIYVNTPNNPSGKVLTGEQLAAIGNLAVKHGLWIISDEAYDGLTFDSREHVSIASIPGLFERTISIFTFSKVFMVAGFRLGYVAAEEEIIHRLNKAMVHQIYSPSTILQYFVVDAVKNRKQWMGSVRENYERIRNEILQDCRFSVHQPEGTYFVFFDTRPMIASSDYWRVVESMIDREVLVAPGADFGRDFSSYVRICFTGEKMDRIKRGIQVINEVLGVG